MPRSRNNGRRRKLTKKSVSVRPRRRLSRPQRTGTTGSGIGPIVSSGVKTLLSVLPGSSITTKIADFVFKSVGWSTKPPSGAVYTDVAFGSLVGAFYVSPRMIASGIPGRRVIDTSGNINSIAISSNYTEFRIIDLALRLETTAPAGKASGCVWMGFVPFVDSSSPSISHSITPIFIQSLQYHTSVRMGGTGSLRYRARVEDLYFYQFHLSEDKVGVVYICYENLNRTSYHEFTSDDFACQVRVSGHLAARGYNPYDFTDIYTHTEDVLHDVMCYVYCPKTATVPDLNVHVIKAGTCTKNGAYCNVTATDQSVVPLRRAHCAISRGNPDAGLTPDAECLAFEGSFEDLSIRTG